TPGLAPEPPGAAFLPPRPATSPAGPKAAPPLQGTPGGSGGVVAALSGGDGPGLDGVTPQTDANYVPRVGGGPVVGAGAGADAGDPGAAGYGPAGVRYADGGVSVARTDLQSAGFGTPWAEGGEWTNAAATAPANTAGAGWARPHLPYLKDVKGDGSVVAVVTGGTDARYYDYDSLTGLYAPRQFVLDGLTHSGTQFVLADTAGTVTRFDDFSTSVAAARRGKFASLTDPYGTVTSVTSYTGANLPAEVRRSATVGSTTYVESYQYAYVASGTNAGLLDAVTLRRSADGGSTWATVRSVQYAYYDGTTSYGSAGDLRTATVKDAGGTAIGTSYYRYYTSADAGTVGYAGGLKYEFTPAAYARLVANYATPTTATDSQVAPYADRAFRYDPTSHRVTRADLAGAGADGASPAGIGTFTYTYSASGSNPGYNVWDTKTVEARPDGTTATVYTNAYAEPMLVAVAGGGTTWRWFTQYDGKGRVVLSAPPAAVTGQNDTYPDLLQSVSGNYTYLADSAGPVTGYDYYSSTTAGSSTAGGVAGYRQYAKVKKGETGTAVTLSSTQYFQVTAGGATLSPVANRTVYRNDNGTGSATTSHAYTHFSGTVRVQSDAVTLPAVTTGQNGSGTGVTSTTYFDVWGRPAWAKDGAGFLSYAAYDPPTGAVSKAIADVDTTQTSTFTGLPSGWSTPSGGGLHLTTAYEVDGLGRTTKLTAPNGRVDYAVYNDPGHEVRQYPGWTGTATTGPTVLARDDWSNGYTEALTMSATPAASGGRPTGGESVGSVQALARAYRNPAGQVTQSDAYFDLSGLTYSSSTSLGTEGTNFYRTRAGYDVGGRADRSVTPQGTITRAVYDALGRQTSEWVGTDDTPTSGSWSPTNTANTNLVKVREWEYDGGGAGDGTLTKATDYPGLSGTSRVTQTWYDWRDRAVLTKAGVEGSESTSVNRPITYLDYDNLGRVVKARRYDGDGVTVTVTSGVPDAPSSSLLRAQSTTSYDEAGRVYRAETFSVDPSSGSVGTYTLKADTWYDPRGLAIKQSAPGGVVTKTAYDGAGRPTTVSTTDGGGDSAYSDAATLTGDAVLEQVTTAYDASGNVLSVTSKERFHDETTTGALGNATTAPKARVSYAGYYYDGADRVTAVADVGTNGGSAWTRPGSAPSRSDTVLVTSTAYDAAGRPQDVTDPKAVVTRTSYDALGRTTKVVGNYVNGTVSDADDLTTEYAYNGAGRTSLTAKLTGGGVQTTQWVYGVTDGGGGSGVNSNDVVGAVRWPDPSTGAASSSQQETVTVNALGQTATSTDRNGTVHTLAYDVLGRVTADAVTTLGSGVDGAVRRFETAYDGQGNASQVTTYTASSGGSVVAQVKRDYNGLGQLTADWQSHSGAVTGSTPKVQYAYSEMSGGANHSRPTSVTYPSGYVLTSNYASGLASNISRLSSLSDTTGTVEGYDYLGLETVVRRTHSQPGVDLTYVKQSGESNGDAGDQYAGLDRFGRVVDQRWIKTSSGTATDRFGYGYDRDSNRLYRDNLVNTAFGELYAYDGLGQVTSFDRGTLNGTKTGLTGAASRAQDWDYDAAGNWDSVVSDGTTQTRSANRQNEVTAVSGATTPTFDANGNLTTDETGKGYVYDAWGRLVTVKNSGGTTLETLAYDGLGRRVSGTASGTTTDLYYSDQWQVLEEKVGSNTAARYVWSPAYVDALVLRDRDTDS
ncbi:MAG: hypothetical protein K2X87_22410, partial [Gemmataceae bacterium]|nr:hypothetical protein [Gemmataceae bacterium]